MKNFKPITELRNYKEILEQVKDNAPVYLTREGKSEYAIVKVEDLEKLQSTITLLSEIEKGEQSARDKKWISADEVDDYFSLKG
ncbi:type II toxin-antitoxin system Phd/YefM family antitoxin [Mangrovibacillus cuniculi]|uniref:Antitoxin n=1 Tax=Mangrovibacillus cuniculi TaxID=2593652 RepID=A0A7S8HEI6_9BACI|nr:type II toxin-antitoxin system Phd/YefM family antitoxin [Mangrovibacillus cuniculi]QPC45531.1 type II toxin-antitoxin system Phd/YefM family antitoxin [Mangrovibacillus cuniculi]